MKKFYNEDKKQKRFYSVKEAANILGVSTNTIYKYLDEGSLKGKRLSGRGRFKIPHSEISPYLTTEVTSKTIKEPQVETKTQGQLAIFELFSGVLVGMGILYVIWNFGLTFLNLTKSGLVADTVAATLNYSGRTSSGFGDLVTRTTKLAASVTKVSALATAPTGRVLSLKSFDYPTESIGLWGLIIFFSALAFLVIYLIMTVVRGNRKSEQTGSDKKEVFEPKFSPPRMTFHASKEFLTNIISSVTKAIISVITALLKIPAFIITFFSRVAYSIANLIISIATSLKQGFGALIHAITTFFAKIISVIRSALTSIKTGLLIILVSTTTFFLKIVSLTTKLVVSIITGLANLIVAIATSLKQGFGSIIHAITTSFAKIISSIITFFANVASSAIKALISLKTGLLKVLISIKTFFLRSRALTVNLIVSVLVSLKRGLLAITHATTTFFVNIISAITKVIVAITGALLKIPGSIITFFLKVLSLTANLLVAISASLRQGFHVIIHSITKALILVKTGLVKIMSSAILRVNFQITTLILLVGATSAVISAVLGLKLMSVMGKEDIDQNQKTLVKVPDTSVDENSQVLSIAEEFTGEKVVINKTPTGWLRVRNAPQGEEVGKVYPGDSFDLIDKSEDWFLIEISADEKGWISSQFATIR